MSTFWSIWIIACTVIVMAGSWWLLFATRKVEVKGEPGKEGEAPTTGHVYDGIEEYDNPLPGWWFTMFVVTIIFGVIYLILYPGFGSFKGVLGWTQIGQWEQEVKAAEERYGPLYDKYLSQSIEEVIADPAALKMGGRLFANNCSVCHGSDARGATGFPNLTDSDWLYGGTSADIKTSIANGRSGMMPAWGSVMGEDGVNATTEYVFSLSGRDHDAAAAANGKTLYGQYCAACHGPEGKGNTAVGAPNLTDSTWLYGGSPAVVRHSIRNGRSNNVMPAHKDLLQDGKIHLLTAYVYQLSKNN